MTEQTDLADRYGVADPWRRRALLLACVLVVLAFGAWLTWVIVAESTPEVDSELIGYDVQGQHAAVATVDIRLADEDVRASCTLRAYAEDHSVVGELVFTPESTWHRPSSRCAPSGWRPPSSCSAARRRGRTGGADPPLRHLFWAQLLTLCI